VVVVKGYFSVSSESQAGSRVGTIGVGTMTIWLSHPLPASKNFNSMSPSLPMSVN
jgi:hypothetical protein